MSNISKERLLGLTIILPPIKLQEQFAAFVEQVDKSKVAVQKALDEAQTLFDSLMQEYFG
jgi:type I restriction enzyme S subunit